MLEEGYQKAVETLNGPSRIKLSLLVQKMSRDNKLQAEYVFILCSNLTMIYVFM